MAVPIRLTPPTSANVMASETSDTPAPHPVTTTNLEEDMANLAVSPTQLVPSTHVTRIAELDADDQALSLAISPATGASSDVVEATAGPRGFFALPRELRHEIYKLLDQTVEQTMWYGRDRYGDYKLLHEPPGGCNEEDEEGTTYPHVGCEHDEDFEEYDLETTVSLPQLRLVNKQFKQEYNESYELANNRLEISTSSGFSGRDWDGLQLPSISRHSTKLEMSLIVGDYARSYSGCVWCRIRAGPSMKCPLGSFDSLLAQVPSVVCVRIDLLIVFSNSRRSLKRRSLGYSYEHDRCPGFEYWRDRSEPSDTRYPHSRHLLQELAGDPSHLGLGQGPRLPPKLFVSIGRDVDKPYENQECIATWTSEGGLQVDLDAANRCNLEVYRT